MSYANVTSRGKFFHDCLTGGTASTIVRTLVGNIPASFGQFGGSILCNPTR
jgi:hypothetical protein